MKRLFYILFLSALSTAFSQTNPPAGITFQAVAIDENGLELSGVDAAGIPIPDKAIKVQFSILSGSASGNIEFSEEHLTNTDKYGLFTLIIGNGTINIGKDLKSIDWHSGNKFLKVELDLNNGKGYKLVSVQQMLSVPYAFYSGESLEAKKVDTLRMRDSVLHSSKIQKVQSNLDKHISADMDTVPTNELQTLSIKGGTIFLSQGGGSLKIPDSSSVNEIQTLSVSGNKLTISGFGGNMVTLPTSSSDGDTTYWKVKGSKLNYSLVNVGNGITDPNLPFSSLTVQGGTTIVSDSSHAHFLNKNFTLGSPTLKLYTSGNNNTSFYGINAERAYLGGDGKLVLNQYGGNVGIGNIDPQRPLHVNDVMRLQPRNTAPASPAKGDIYFDNTSNKLRVFDGTVWQNCW